MEDSSKNSGGAQSTEEGINASQSKSCQSSPSSGQVKAAGSRGSTHQQQQQQLGSGHRQHLAMAPQHPALSGGQAPSSHGGWTAPPVWEHARNITEGMEGGGTPDYNGGRSLEWDVKGSPWEWEQMALYPGRRGEAYGSQGSFGHSSESVSVGATVVSPGNRGSLCKGEDFREKAVPESGRGGNLGGVEQRPPSQGALMNIDQQRRLGLELETGGSAERRKSNLQEHSNGARPKVGGDSLIGLKLGRRTYFEDSAGGRGGGGGAAFPVCPPGKKRGLQSPGVQVPRCQVEGCKQDLSVSKDYHRRHKVCEMHSKAAKVLASGFEQRFCQQCSRFHVLTEFDEGKRSCRRRLAGHNERRRKPQPESAAIVSTGSSAAFHSESGSHATSVNGEEDKQGTNGLGEQACFNPMQRTPGSSSTSVESDDQSGSLGTNFRLNQGKGPWPVLGRSDDSTGMACQSRVPCGERQPYLSSTTTDRLLKFLQGPKGPIPGAGVHQLILEGSSGSMGPGLTLASSSGPASVLSGLEVPTSPSVSGISDSGRALSLLSSQGWGSRGGASGPVSGAMSTQSDVTLEQLISENARSPFSPRGSQSHFHSTAPGATEKSFCLQPHSARDVTISSISRPESRDQHRGMMSGLGMVGNFENHSMLAVMQGQSEFRGIQGSTNSTQRPTIDLMQMPSPQSHGQFAELSVLRPFESTLFDSQQML